MFGILLIFGGSLFDEIALTLGKKTVTARAQSLYSMGFLQMIGGLAMLVGINFWRDSAWVFSWESIYTLGPRLLLEIIQFHFTLLAIRYADRSTYGFMRVLTIPLLFGADVILGYQFSAARVLGMGIVLIALVAAFFGKEIRRVGAAYALVTAVNGAVTISLYKYNITHFNSVAAEETIVVSLLTVYCLALSYFKKRERPWRLLSQPKFLAQTITAGISIFFEAFAFLYAPASVILAGKRSSAVLWSTLSGNMYFKEKKLLAKLGLLIFLVTGITLLAMG